MMKPAFSRVSWNTGRIAPARRQPSQDWELSVDDLVELAAALVL